MAQRTRLGRELPRQYRADTCQTQSSSARTSDGQARSAEAVRCRAPRRGLEGVLIATRSTTRRETTSPEHDESRVDLCVNNAGSVEVGPGKSAKGVNMVRSEEVGLEEETGASHVRDRHDRY
jgi:hypothetical protein